MPGILAPPRVGILAVGGAPVRLVEPLADVAQGRLDVPPELVVAAREDDQVNALAVLGEARDAGGPAHVDRREAGQPVEQDAVG